jgi:hypothetical protein
VERLLLRNARLRALVQCLLDSDPSEPVADSGETVLDAWRKEARAALERKAAGNR